MVPINIFFLSQCWYLFSFLFPFILKICTKYSSLNWTIGVITIAIITHVHLRCMQYFRHGHFLRLQTAGLFVLTSLHKLKQIIFLMNALSGFIKGILVGPKFLLDNHVTDYELKLCTTGTNY